VPTPAAAKAEPKVLSPLRQKGRLSASLFNDDTVLSEALHDGLEASSQPMIPKARFCKSLISKRNEEMANKNECRYV
jgi:hypothetical protein